MDVAKATKKGPIARDTMTEMIQKSERQEILIREVECPAGGRKAAFILKPLEQECQPNPILIRSGLAAHLQLGRMKRPNLHQLIWGPVSFHLSQWQQKQWQQKLSNRKDLHSS